MLREVKTAQGIVRGLAAADPRVTSFRGIPFAKPPIGENRFRAPQEPEPWEGILLADDFGPIPMQSTPGLGTDLYCREWHVDPEIPMSEDCLYLNIWTNAKTGTENMPVLVWFFGGGLQWGYTAEMEFDGERLARRDIVVVTVGYRLNCFGFMCHPEITKENPEAPANFGNLDQHMALKWVQKNIAAFGGDPKNVTIAGQSAGAGSVMMQLQAKQNAGLFSKAVIMSGMIEQPGQKNIGFPAELADAEKLGERFFEFLGIKTLAEARAMDAFKLRDAYYDFMWKNGMMMTVRDNMFCCGDPLTQLRNGEIQPVTIMTGNTSNEFLYEENGEWKNPVQLCTRASIMKNHESSKPTTFYYYEFDAEIPGEDNPGCFHSVDLWFWFETLAKCSRAYVGKHYDLARHMANYFSNFVKTGDPNGLDSDGTLMKRWEPFEAETKAEMLFQTKG